MALNFMVIFGDVNNNCVYIYIVKYFNAVSHITLRTNYAFVFNFCLLSRVTMLQLNAGSVNTGLWIER